MYVYLYTLYISKRYVCARVITKTHSRHKSPRNPIAITALFLRRHVLRNPYVWDEISIYAQGDEEKRWLAKKKNF